MIASVGWKLIRSIENGFVSYKVWATIRIFDYDFIYMIDARSTTGLSLSRWCTDVIMKFFFENLKKGPFWG